MIKRNALFLSIAILFMRLFMSLSMNLSSIEQQADKLRILAYNTHGLSELFISDNPKKRFSVIDKKLKTLVSPAYKKTIRIMRGYYLA